MSYFRRSPQPPPVTPIELRHEPNYGYVKFDFTNGLWVLVDENDQILSRSYEIEKLPNYNAKMANRSIFRDSKEHCGTRPALYQKYKDVGGMNKFKSMRMLPPDSSDNYNCSNQEELNNEQFTEFGKTFGSYGGTRKSRRKRRLSRRH